MWIDVIYVVTTNFDKYLSWEWSVLFTVYILYLERFDLYLQHACEAVGTSVMYPNDLQFILEFCGAWITGT